MLTGKSALVTGSTGGIGFATARSLARKGCAVMLHGLCEPDEAERIRAGLAAECGVTVGFDGANLADPAEVERLMRVTRETVGPVDILVNNAVTRAAGPIDEMPVEKWDLALAVNLSAPFHTIRLALPHMKAQRWGRIINIASNWGLTGTRNRGDYVATKHGIVGLTKAVALETLEHGITCNAIAPGATLTPNAERQLRERMSASGKSREEVERDFFTERQPSRRFVRPEDVAELIAFLCGEHARDMTGTPVSIDGGWLAI